MRTVSFREGTLQMRHPQGGSLSFRMMCYPSECFYPEHINPGFTVDVLRLQPSIIGIPPPLASLIRTLLLMPKIFCTTGKTIVMFFCSSLKISPKKRFLFRFSLHQNFVSFNQQFRNIKPDICPLLVLPIWCFPTPPHVQAIAGPGWA